MILNDTCTLPAAVASTTSSFNHSLYLRRFAMPCLAISLVLMQQACSTGYRYTNKQSGPVGPPPLQGVAGLKGGKEGRVANGSGLKIAKEAKPSKGAVASKAAPVSAEEVGAKDIADLIVEKGVSAPEDSKDSERLLVTSDAVSLQQGNPGSPANTKGDSLAEPVADGFQADGYANLFPPPPVDLGGSDEAKGKRLLAFAKQFIGVPYRYGGGNPDGFDCSGLVNYSMANVLQKKVPRTSAELAQIGSTVSANNAIPGDLVFFNTSGSPNSHVGIYAGEGQFLHAPSSGGTVRMDALSSPYWSKRVNQWRRIF